MIALHRITQPDHELYLNPDLIQTVEANPDTVIALTNGSRFVVVRDARRGRSSSVARVARRRSLRRRAAAAHRPMLANVAPASP